MAAHEPIAGLQGLAQISTAWPVPCHFVAAAGCHGKSLFQFDHHKSSVCCKDLVVWSDTYSAKPCPLVSESTADKRARFQYSAACWCRNNCRCNGACDSSWYL
jgi:hypothetical protein